MTLAARSTKRIRTAPSATSMPPGGLGPARVTRGGSPCSVNLAGTGSDLSLSPGIFVPADAIGVDEGGAAVVHAFPVGIVVGLFDGLLQGVVDGIGLDRDGVGEIARISGLHGVPGHAGAPSGRAVPGQRSTETLPRSTRDRDAAVARDGPEHLAVDGLGDGVLLGRLLGGQQPERHVHGVVLEARPLGFVGVRVAVVAGAEEGGVEELAQAGGIDVACRA